MLQVFEGAAEESRASARTVLGPVPEVEVFTMTKLLGPDGPGLYAPASAPYAAVLNLALGLSYRMWALACIEAVTDLLGMYRCVSSECFL